MEVIVGQKRSRDETAGGDLLDVSSSKKLCEVSADIAFDLVGSVAAALSAPIPEVPFLSSEEELPAKVDFEVNSAVGAESLAAMVESLRHLEEELGVSDDCGDFSVPSTEVGEEFPNSAIGSWGEEIWNVHGFDNRDDDNLLTTEFVRSSENNSSSVSGSLSQAKSGVSADANLGDATARILTPNALERFGAVDIGFLLEASDDELGIPPSPSSEVEQSNEGHACQQASINTPDMLHEKVTWALECGDDNIAFKEHGMDDWIGNLDFIIDAPVNYSIPPLGEAGLVMCNPY